MGDHDLHKGRASEHVTAVGVGAVCANVVRGLDRRTGVSLDFVYNCPTTVVVLHAETSGAAVLPPLAGAGAIVYGPA